MLFEKNGKWYCLEIETALTENYEVLDKDGEFIDIELSLEERKQILGQ